MKNEKDTRLVFWCKCKNPFFANFCVKVLFFSHFSFLQKNYDKACFNQHFEWSAPKRWSKYTTCVPKTFSCASVIINIVTGTKRNREYYPYWILCSKEILRKAQEFPSLFKQDFFFFTKISLFNCFSGRRYSSTFPPSSTLICARGLYKTK